LFQPRAEIKSRILPGAKALAVGRERRMTSPRTRPIIRRVRIGFTFARGCSIAFLKTKLGDGKPHPVVQVHNDADAAGVDPDALHRARNMLPIQSRFGPGRPSTWMMEMDQAPAPTR
jgi:hypothetical protein